MVKDAVYKYPDLKDVDDAQNHLKESQRNILLHVLKKHQDIFKVKRGNWLGQDVDIELKTDATPSLRELIVYLKRLRSHSGKRFQGWKKKKY